MHLHHQLTGDVRRPGWPWQHMTEDPLGLYWVGHSEVPSVFFRNLCSHHIWRAPAIPLTSASMVCRFSSITLLPLYRFVCPPSHPLSPSTGLCYGPLLPKYLLHRERLDVSLRSSPPGHGFCCGGPDWMSVACLVYQEIWPTDHASSNPKVPQTTTLSPEPQRGPF